MHLYLPEVGVPAILVIGQHSDLDKKGSDRASASIPRRDVHPTCGLVQVNGLQFLKVVEAAANPHRDPEMCLRDTVTSFIMRTQEQRQA